MTPKQEAALRDYLQEAIMPLIEQVLVKKLGQAMSFAAEELIQLKPSSKPWVGLTEEEAEDIWNRYCDEMGEASINDAPDIAQAIESALRSKNT